MKTAKKKKIKKTSPGIPRGLQALAKLTSSDMVEQVKIGMSKIAPLDTEEDLQEPTL